MGRYRQLLVLLTDIDPHSAVHVIREQVAVTDYHLKAQARQFWGALALLQEIRQGVRDSRDRVRG